MSDLTPRQAQILRLVATGRTNAEIAAALGVGEETVRSHLREACGRLGISGHGARVQAAVWWTQQTYTAALVVLAGTEER